MNKIKLEKTFENKSIEAKYFRFRHENGLEILLYPMPLSSGTYALYGTKYGSIDRVFKKDIAQNFTSVPDGIAHYLEHKLFESADENGKAADVFRLFSKTGANANAFTSFDRTAYLFSSDCETFYDNLKILLGFVQDPFFTDENVEKERGIIEQEIKMYQDDPSWRVFFNCLAAVYSENPVRADIAGTVESIAKITPELLYECYNTFYSPGNMIFAAAGNFDIDKTIEICSECLKDTSVKFTVERAEFNEPNKPIKNYTLQNLPCAFPLWQLAFKLSPEVEKDEKLSFKISHSLKILLDVLFGELTEWYDKNYESGLLNEQFDKDVFFGRGYLLPVISGECEEPEKIRDKIFAVIQETKDKGFSAEQKDIFNLVRKSERGDDVRALSVPSSVASGIFEAGILGVDYFDKSDIIEKLTLDDLSDALNLINIENTVLSVVQNN